MYVWVIPWIILRTHTHNLCSYALSMQLYNITDTYTCIFTIFKLIMLCLQFTNLKNNIIVVCNMNNHVLLKNFQCMYMCMLSIVYCIHYLIFIYCVQSELLFQWSCSPAMFTCTLISLLHWFACLHSRYLSTI